MATPNQPLPSGGLTREEVARRDLGHTTIAASTTRLLLAVFLTAIVAAPLLEVAFARVRARTGSASAWSHLQQIPSQLRSHLELPPSEGDQPGFWQRFRSTNRIVLAGLSEFERGLENESTIGRALRPRVQALMAGWLGAGNERVYVGRDGWLFYRPDVESLSGPGFLDPVTIERRITATSEWNTPPAPDSRPAIAQLHRDLEARAITLVVMPVPVKAAVHPEMLAGRYARTAAPETSELQNPSYRDWIDGLRRDGIAVFDTASALAAGRGAGPMYLKTDTHWRPEAMEIVAERLADFIAERVTLPAGTEPGYRIERVEQRNAGDIARMLDLPPGETLYPPESVWLARVLRGDGSSWRSSPDSDVLVLGDSFSNIYSLESMGWGTSAGFVEHLSYALRRPVDRLVQNDQAAFATRELLQRSPDRLQGKRVVIYQFAARELAFGDWKVLPLPTRATNR